MAAVRLLLKAGADATLKDRNGRTPLEVGRGCPPNPLKPLAPCKRAFSLSPPGAGVAADIAARLLNVVGPAGEPAVRPRGDRGGAPQARNAAPAPTDLRLSVHG